MSDINEFLDRHGIPEQEAIQVLLSAFAPMQPGTLRQNWLRNVNFGQSAPDIDVIWSKFEAAGFSCTQCRSKRRITLDHINGNQMDHTPENLRVLCFSCNRARSARRTGDSNHNVRIYNAIVALWQETGRFPTNAQILLRAGVEQIGGQSSLVRWLEYELVHNAEARRAD